MNELLLFLKRRLPEVFPGKEIDKLSGNIFRWRTMQNMRCNGKIPQDCFFRLSARKILVNRDKFLEWVTNSQNTTQ